VSYHKSYKSENWQQQIITNQ